ncbi:MAG: hypothetical protein K6E47_12205 [Lachnospiraceae bacterium]|nr:hypothetical protein [Lachnospiraceae bacterium]
MMMLAFVIAAMTYSKRNECPERFVLSLWFLCLTSAYGIVIAGGICIAWLIEMCRKTYDKSSLKSTILWLAGLLTYVLFIFYRIIPAENTYAIIHGSIEAKNGILIRALYSFFGILSDSFITNVYHENEIFQNVQIDYLEFIISIVLGALLLSGLIFFAIRKKAFASFIIPYVFLCLFTLLVYIYPTHIGIMFMFIGFHLWIQKTDGNDQVKNDKTLVRNVGVILPCIIILVSIVWSISSCISEVFYEYAFGKNEYSFLVEHSLEKCTFLTDTTNVDFNDDMNIKELKVQNFFSDSGVCISPYIDSELLINGAQNLGSTYSQIHKLISIDDWEKQISMYKTYEKPEVLLGLPDLNASFMDGAANLSEYTKVYEKRCATIFKGVPGAGFSYIYVKNELAKEKGLKGLD